MSRRRSRTDPPSHKPALRPIDGPKRRHQTSLVLLVVLAGVVAVVVLAVHWPALSARALGLDDNEYLVHNELVLHPGWASARRFLGEVRSPSTVKGYYQPLTMISLMLDVAVGGRPDNLVPFHRTSLILHVANSVLVVVLLYMLFARPWAAALVGLLFGIHPLTVEPISWVGERKTLLAAFFALWCLVFYVRYVQGRGNLAYALCLIGYVLSVLSKPTSTTLPIAMLLIDFWPLRRLSRRAVIEKIPLFMLGALSAVVTYLSQARTAAAWLPTEYAPSQIPLILCHNIVFYLAKIVWPVRLSPFYPFPEPLSWSDGMILTGVIGTCLLVPALVISLSRTRALLTGWLFFFIVIFPTMGVIGFTVVIAADKYVYLPAVGLLMTLAWLLIGLWRIPSRRPRYRFLRGALVGAAVVVPILLATASRRQLDHWRTTDGLYEYMLALAPRSALLHYNSGLHLANEGRLREAVEHYTEALRLSPQMNDADNNLGTALAGLGRHDEAVRHFRRAHQLKPEDSKACSNLGNALSDQGKLDEAIGYYARALQANPRCAEAHNNLANALAAQGKHEQAIEHYAAAVRIRPSFPEAHRNLGLAMADRGDLDAAIGHYRQALRLRPDDAQIHNLLGLALTRAGRTTEAIACYTEALRLDPACPEARKNLQVASQIQTDGVAHSSR